MKKQDKVIEDKTFGLKNKGKSAKVQKFVQQVAGALKFPERLKPRLAWPLWKLFRVMSYPYPVEEAYMAARLLLELAYSHRQEGITFGGDIDTNPRLLAFMHAEVDVNGSPPIELEGHSDATWNTDADSYAAVITRYGGAVHHGVWAMKLICDSAALAEGVASGRVAEKLMLVQEIERGVGLARATPPVLTTDSSSSWQIATRHTSANRARHALRRWRVLMERIRERELIFMTVPGLQQPADFMTKLTSGNTINVWVNYITNARNAVPPVTQA